MHNNNKNAKTKTKRNVCQEQRKVSFLTLVFFCFAFHHLLYYCNIEFKFNILYFYLYSKSLGPGCLYIRPQFLKRTVNYSDPETGTANIHCYIFTKQSLNYWPLLVGLKIQRFVTTVTSTILGLASNANA